MDALILCGGFATRLEPMTFFVPKSLLPISGRPILDHVVDHTVKAGADRLILSTNKKFYDQFKYWANNKMASGFDKKIEIVVEPTMNHGEKFGAIKGINYTIESANLADDLLIIAGDNFFDFDLKRLVEHFKKTHAATIAIHDMKNLKEAKRFGVVEMEGDIVKGFQEKPEAPKSSLISTGIYLFPKSMLRKFQEYITNGNNPDAPGYFLQWLIDGNKIYGVVYSEDWYDIGTVETYKEVFDRRLSKHS